MFSQNQNGKQPSFDPEQVRKVLGSDEGKKLLQLLSRDGGAALRQAAQAMQRGDMQGAQEVMRPIMSTREAETLVKKINEKQG